MKKVKIIFSFLCLFLVFGCSSYKNLGDTDLSGEVIKLPYKINTLKVVDVRGELLPMDWKVPLIAAKSREWVGNPELSEQNRSYIRQEILNSQDSQGIIANAEFRIVEGLCRLSADWKSVREYAKFRCELILKIPSQNYFYKSYSEMFYDKPKINGTEKGTLILYEQALKNATIMALKEIKREINDKTQIIQ